MRNMVSPHRKFPNKKGELTLPVGGAVARLSVYSEVHVMHERERERERERETERDRERQRETETETERDK